MKYIKTNEEISEKRIKSDIKIIKDNIKLFSDVLDSFHTLNDYCSVMSRKTTQTQTDRFIGYLHLHTKDTYATDTLIEIIYNYSKYPNPHIELRYNKNALFNNILNDFISNAINSNSYMLSSVSYRDKYFDNYYIHIEDVNKLIDDISINNYEIFKDSKTYNI